MRVLPEHPRGGPAAAPDKREKRGTFSGVREEERRRKIQRVRGMS